MYLQPEDLKTEIDNYHQTGIVSERLGGMLLSLADGVFKYTADPKTQAMPLVEPSSY
jgi:hypothetical protein